MFKDFVEERIVGDGATLFLRRAGPVGAPPLVLLHGYPQTSAMWHGVAPILARTFQVICPDLRGGARVAHRLGLDHPDRVSAMALLDIAPTREMYAGTSAGFAQAYWHWFFLTQPSPLPERMIGADPEGFWKLKCFNQARGDNPFSPEALAEYLSAFADPDAIHASCEDYRAAATIDIAHDD